MDNFERHIRNNASLFDQHRPDRDKIWSAITENFDHRDMVVHVPLWRLSIVRFAACFIFLVGLTIYFFLGQGFLGTSHENTITSFELMEINDYYQRMVEEQIDLIQEYTGLNVEDKSRFLKFLDELDREHGELKKELERNLDNERIINAIIENYKMRIELMENFLKQVEHKKLKLTENEVYVL